MQSVSRARWREAAPQSRCDSREVAARELRAPQAERLHEQHPVLARQARHQVVLVGPQLGVPVGEPDAHDVASSQVGVVGHRGHDHRTARYCWRRAFVRRGGAAVDAVATVADVAEASSSHPAPGVDLERARREREAYDEHGVEEAMYAWHGRFPHVFQSPNTRRAEERFDALTRAAVAGRRVLDMGCGEGASSERLLGLGARVCARHRHLADGDRSRRDPRAAGAAGVLPG